jgi:magnesium-transporting ATPase (P-type)
MQWNKKTIMIVGLAGGIMLFFIGMAAYIILGPSTDTYLLPKQISSVIKLTGMGIVCISMIVGGFFIEKIEKDTKLLLLLFGVILLLLNIFLFSSSHYY